MTHCRRPKFCERYGTDVGMYDNKRQIFLPRSAKQRDVSVYNQKNHYCFICKKNRKAVLVHGVEKKETSNLLKEG